MRFARDWCVYFHHTISNSDGICINTWAQVTAQCYHP